MTIAQEKYARIMWDIARSQCIKEMVQAEFMRAPYDIDMWLAYISTYEGVTDEQWNDMSRLAMVGYLNGDKPPPSIISRAIRIAIAIVITAIFLFACKVISEL